MGSAQRNRFAAFDPSTTALLDQDPSFNATVDALTVGGRTIFAGGTFTAVDGVPRPRLAAVHISSGALTGWAPQADSAVNALTLTADRTKVVAGGAFNQVNGVDGRGLVALDAASGARDPWAINTVAQDYGPNAAVLGLTADRDTVYVTGYGFRAAARGTVAPNAQPGGHYGISAASRPRPCTTGSRRSMPAASPG